MPMLGGHTSRILSASGFLSLQIEWRFLYGIPEPGPTTAATIHFLDLDLTFERSNKMTISNGTVFHPCEKNVDFQKKCK